MTQSCHNSDLESILTEISPHEVSWDEHRSDAESVKILYNYSVELSKYADRINGCSGILKFGINPNEGKLVLKQAFFFCVRHCPMCQWRRSLLWRAVMFQQLPKYSRTLSYAPLGISNPNCEKSTCYRITWHFEAHEWFMAATDSNQAI